MTGKPEVNDYSAVSRLNRARCWEFGGSDGTRTHGPLRDRQAFQQLNYAPHLESLQLLIIKLAAKEFDRSIESWIESAKRIPS